MRQVHSKRPIIVHSEKTELIRINKFLGESGFCSRREADTLVEQGRVTVNDIPAEQGMKITLNDQIKVDGKLINLKNELK